MAKFVCYVFSLFVLAYCDLIPDRKPYKKQALRCPRLHLENGRTRLRMKGRFAYFLCNKPFTLVGNKFAYCEKRKWSSEPLCVSSNCSRPHPTRRLRVLERRPNAHLAFSCPDGYLLKGSPTLICQEGRWNGTVPTCESTAQLVNQACDFEADLCGWEQSPDDDFDWILGRGETVTKLTGPSHDHTHGEGRGGHYLYLDALDELYNHSPHARLLSPTLSRRISQTSCLQFWYHSYGVSIGKLNVYLQPLPTDADASLTAADTPEMLEMPVFTTSGNKGDKWLLANITLPDLDTSFKIIIEGMMGEGFLGDLAIDDVKLYQCKRFDLPLVEPEPTVVTTTTRRIITTTIKRAQRPAPTFTERALTDQPAVTAKGNPRERPISRENVKKSWKPINRVNKIENTIYRDVAPLLGAKTETWPEDTETIYITGALLVGITVSTVLLSIGCYLRKYRASLPPREDS